MLRVYLLIWLTILVFFSYEYAALNTQAFPSLLHLFSLKFHRGWNLSPDPGRTLSLSLGWAGMCLMVAMNVYSLRKRLSFLRGRGRLAAWLNFHVFCGLLGPTFILFHCNFKVRGLVAIAFWSMMISFASGVIGRYFYQQIALKKIDLQRDSDKWKTRLIRFLDRASIPWSDKQFAPVLQQALAIAGMPSRGVQTPPLQALAESMWGDFRLRTTTLPLPPGWPPQSEYAVREYAVNLRRAATLESFRRLMGYWHAFHFPFAIFMYITATIHVASSLVLGV